MDRVPSRAVLPLPLQIGLPAGRVIVRQGEPGLQPMSIALGAVYLSVVDAEGRVLGLDVAGKGDVVGEVVEGPARATARAVAPCRLTPVPPARIAPLVQARADRLSRLACQLAWLDVPARVRLRLIDLARRFGRATPAGTLVALGLTQEDLANLCGTSRETANRTLHDLRRRGMVRLLGRGRFLIPRDRMPGQLPAASPAASPSCNITRLHVPQ